MPYDIASIQTVRPVEVSKLAAVGIATTDDLVRFCRTPEGRRVVATETGIDGPRLLVLCRHAELVRVDGVHPEYAAMLVAADIRDLGALARSNPSRLADRIVEINGRRGTTRHVPPLTVLQHWIARAGELETFVTT